MNEDMPWVNLTQEEVEQLRKQKYEITEYAKEKLRKLIYEQDMKKMEDAIDQKVLDLMKNQEPYPDAMFEEAERRERANELYQDALHELDNLAAGVDSEDFMNAYLVIQSALKVALGEEDV